MFGMGMGELIVILIVALLVLGPDKIPEAAKAIGKGMRELRRQTKGLQDTLEQDEQLSSTVREIKSALRGDDLPASIRPPAARPPRPLPPPETPPVAQVAAPAPAAAEAAPTPAAADAPAPASDAPPAKDPGSTHG
jgi:sec-independent protein translocase protein TatB